jgi:TonB family protein
MRRLLANGVAVLLLFLAVQSVSGHAQTVGNAHLPPLVDFVAPAYPRLANDARMTGTTVTHIKIGKDGSVVEAKIVSAHPVFATYVLAALRLWKFTPSEEQHEFDVTCRFEFYFPDAEQCLKPDGTPTTPETIVSATLPTQVLIRTTERCITVTSSDPVKKHQ